MQCFPYGNSPSYPHSVTPHQPPPPPTTTPDPNTTPLPHDASPSHAHTVSVQSSPYDPWVLDARRSIWAVGAGRVSNLGDLVSALANGGLDTSAPVG